MVQQSVRIDAQTNHEDARQELVGIRRWKGVRGDEEKGTKVNSVAGQIGVVVTVSGGFFSGSLCAIYSLKKRGWISSMRRLANFRRTSLS